MKQRHFEFIRRLWTFAVRTAALLFALQIAIGICGLPRPFERWLTGYDKTPRPDPRYVIVLGGGGIPSDTGLMRTYCAAQFGLEHPASEFIVSLPSDGDPDTNSVGRMKRELIIRGIPASKIKMETRALNTREQAVNVARLLGPAALAQPVRLVTSPTHIRRSLLCFRKAGFQNVTALAAANTGAEADIGSNGLLRYAFWYNLQIEVDCVRECIALLIYKIRGWA